MEQTLINIIRNNSRELLPIPTGTENFSKNTNKIESIIFDIYGTLLISASGDVGTLTKTSKSDFFTDSLKNCGVQILKEDVGILGLEIFHKEISNSHIASINHNINFPEVVITEIWEKTLKKLIENKMINIKLSDKIILKIATYFECYNNPVWPMPELVNVLNILNKKVVLGIVSNAQFYTPLLFKALTDYSLEDLGFDPKLIYYSYKKKEAKPSISMFNSIKYKLQHLYNINPSNTVYVGNDMLNDIYCANKAGFKTALFAGDTRSLRLRKKDSRVSGLKSDFVITRLIQITELLQ